MKLITRNNYEEFFLLYIDDELNAQQKNAVELFLEENPDLEKELKLFQQLKVQPDNEIFFTEKETLLRSGELNINADNYEEYFLLYADNELSAVQRNEVEMFVLQHPQLQQQFTLIKQTILEPENIEFTNKEILYRYAQNERRIFAFSLSQLAVAAALIGVSVFGWWMFTNNNSQQNTPVAENQKAYKIPEQDSGTTEQTNVIPVQPNNALATNTANEKADVTNEKDLNVSDNKIAGTAKQTDKLSNIENKFKIENEPLIAHVQTEKKKNKDMMVHVEQDQLQQPANRFKIKNLDSESLQNNEIASNIPNNNSNDDVINTIPVSYKELNTSEDDRSFYVGNLNLNKDKVKNLFKKAGRLFNEKAREYADSDGKLQVAVIEINSN